jgi:DNA-binding NarL/FixJ family response regulator
VRIFIACADKTFRLALLWLLEDEPGMVVSCMTGSAEGLVTIVEATQPEVLLFDYELIGAATTNLVGDLLHLDLPPKIVILSLEPQISTAATLAGADAFISKDVPPDTLLPVLRNMRAQLRCS